MKRFICVFLIMAPFFYIIIASSAFQSYSSTEYQGGTDYKMYTLEWHSANFFTYLKDIKGKLYMVYAKMKYKFIGDVK